MAGFEVYWKQRKMKQISGWMNMLTDGTVILVTYSAISVYVIGFERSGKTLL
jgi:hypothetical protein